MPCGAGALVLVSKYQEIKLASYVLCRPSITVVLIDLEVKFEIFFANTIFGYFSQTKNFRVSSWYALLCQIPCMGMLSAWITLFMNKFQFNQSSLPQHLQNKIFLVLDFSLRLGQLNLAKNDRNRMI